MQRRNGDRQRARADDALQDIDKWLDDGELDPTIAAVARTVLEPIAASKSGASNADKE